MHRATATATGAAAWLPLVIGLVASPVVAAPLLYVSTGRLLEVVDADTGQLRKALPLAGGGGPIAVGAAGRLYLPLLTERGLAFHVVDSQRNVVVDTLDVPNELPGVGPISPDLETLRTSADGEALYMIGEIPEQAPPGPGPPAFLGALIKINLADKTVSATRSAALDQPRGCFSGHAEEPSTCSEAPPCRCDRIADFAVGSDGRIVHVLREHVVDVGGEGNRRLVRSDVDLLAIDTSSGEVARASRVLTVSPPAFSGGARLTLLPDGLRAIVTVAEGSRLRCFVEGRARVCAPPTRFFVIALDSGRVERSTSVEQDVFFLTLAPLQARLYAPVFSSKSILVLDARPASLLEPIGTFSLGSRPISAVSVSPGGDRLAVIVVPRKERTLEITGPDVVTVDAMRGSVLARLSAPRSVVSTPELVLTEGCPDAESCFCRLDPDCDDEDPCHIASCRGRDGCSYVRRGCFEGAACLLRTTITTLGGPPGSGCDRLFARFVRLEARIRHALEAGSALPPATPRAIYRRALARARARVERRIVAEVRLHVFPPRLRHGLPLRVCLSGLDFGTQVEILARLRDARRHLAACAASGD